MAYTVREVVPEEYIATDSRQIVDRYRTYEHTQHDTIILAVDNYTDIIYIQINIICDRLHVELVLVCIKSHMSCTFKYCYTMLYMYVTCMIMFFSISRQSHAIQQT